MLWAWRVATPLDRSQHTSVTLQTEDPFILSSSANTISRKVPSQPFHPWAQICKGVKPVKPLFRELGDEGKKGGMI